MRAQLDPDAAPLPALVDRHGPPRHPRLPHLVLRRNLQRLRPVLARLHHQQRVVAHDPRRRRVGQRRLQRDREAVGDPDRRAQRLRAALKRDLAQLGQILPIGRRRVARRLGRHDRGHHVLRRQHPHPAAEHQQRLAVRPHGRIGPIDHRDLRVGRRGARHDVRQQTPRLRRAHLKGRLLHHRLSDLPRRFGRVGRTAHGGDGRAVEQAGLGHLARPLRSGFRLARCGRSRGPTPPLPADRPRSVPVRSRAAPRRRAAPPLCPAAARRRPATARA